jgi:hypothetical protein
MENHNNTNTVNAEAGVAPEPKKGKKAKASKAAKKAKKAAPVAAVLEFAEPDKAGWRYAEGRGGRFCLGASKHHGAEFALYFKNPGMSRFKFVAGFDSEAKALATAEKANAGNGS